MTEEIDPADIMADFIARDAVKDIPRMVLLKKHLQFAYEESRTKNDGGLAGQSRPRWPFRTTSSRGAAIGMKMVF
jgi:hypothetical protein